MSKPGRIHADAGREQDNLGHRINDPTQADLDAIADEIRAVADRYADRAASAHRAFSVTTREQADHIAALEREIEALRSCHSAHQRLRTAANVAVRALRSGAVVTTEGGRRERTTWTPAALEAAATDLDAAICDPELRHPERRR